MVRDRSRDAEASLWSGVSERLGELLGDSGMDNSLWRKQWAPFCRRNIMLS